MKIKAMLIAVLLLVIIIVILQNTQVVPIQILFWELNLPRVICLLTTLLFGFLAGYFIGNMKKK